MLTASLVVVGKALMQKMIVEGMMGTVTVDCRREMAIVECYVRIVIVAGLMGIVASLMKIQVVASMLVVIAERWLDIAIVAGSIGVGIAEVSVIVAESVGIVEAERLIIEVVIFEGLIEILIVEHSKGSIETMVAD